MALSVLKTSIFTRAAEICTLIDNVPKVYASNKGLFSLSLFLKLILGREGGRERERFFHLLMHSLVASCMCPDQGSNPQP